MTVTTVAIVELQLCQSSHQFTSACAAVFGNCQLGPLCIGAAFYTDAGDDVGSLTFDVIAECFEEKRLIMFAMEKRKCTECQVSTLSELSAQYQDMVACGGCNKWFHFSCTKCVRRL